MATVGSAVGLGNIWRFPYQVGEGGGSVFIIFYLIAVFFIGIPAMVGEFIIGRHSHANAVDSFKKIAPNTKWHGIGYLGVFTGFIIDCYYCVVTGWTLYYLFLSASGGLLGNTVEGYSELFTNFAGGTFMPIVFLFMVIAITGIIVSFGVKDGIEKTSKIMMPLLFVTLIVLAVHSLFLPATQEGLDFLFLPKISSLNFDTLLSAIGQAFYSLSLGMACLITYSSYFTDDVNLSKTAARISIIDLMVALLASVIIFPAVFSFGMEPEQGPGLVFKVLPSVFSQMSFGYLWSVMFYVLLFLAALTSFISITEVVVAYVSESFKITRKKAVIITCSIFSVIGAITSLSFGPLKDFTIAGMNIFSCFDYLSTNILLPVGGILTSLFVGWRLDRKIIEEQLALSPSKKFILNLYIFSFRYVIPIAVGAVLIASLLT